MVQSGGQLGKKIIKDYKAETIYNPLTGKQVKTGGSVGKKVLGMYKAKGGEGCKVDNIEVTLCDIAKLPIVQEALRVKNNKLSDIIRKYNELELTKKELLFKLLEPVLGEKDDQTTNVFFMSLKNCNDQLMSKQDCTKKLLKNKNHNVSEEWKSYDAQQQETLRKLLVNLYEIRKIIQFEWTQNNGVKNINLKKTME
jgi:hypothetical protein